MTRAPGTARRERPGPRFGRSCPDLDESDPSAGSGHSITRRVSRTHGWTFPWYSSYGSDFNYDFHTTVDDRVAPVQIFHRTEAELAEAGMPWSESMRGDWPGGPNMRLPDEYDT